MTHASPYRLCAKYSYFFYGAIFILIVQLLLAYQFYNWNEGYERPSHDRWTKAKRKLVSFDRPQQIESKPRTYERQIANFDMLITEVAPFSPTCDIKAEEALAALRRAKTPQCKKEISEIACMVENKHLYKQTLPRFCPLKDENGGEYIGCFKDDNDNRDLSGHNTQFKEDNSPSRCWNHCLRAGYKYAGLQYGHECWCGNDYGKHGQLSEISCASKCPGDDAAVCGGYKAQSIYHTGLGEKPNNLVHLVSTLTDEFPKNAVRVAFIFTLNGRSLRQTKRLFKALFHVNHYFYIHVDSRQEYLYRELVSHLSRFPNVRFAPVRMSTIWGGASLLQMLLTCIEDLLAMKDWNWDFVLNLSESDYPVKTIWDLTNFLTRYRHNNFVKSHGRDTPRFIKKQGLDRTFYECDTHMWRLGHRSLPDGIRIDGGSDWIALSRPYASYIVHGDDALLEGLKIMYKYTLLPAESFFHTLIQNSKFCTSSVDNNLHLTNWRRKQGCKCQYKHIVDWCGCSPNDFKQEDLPRLLGTTEKVTFFARKFEAIVDQTVINKLDAVIYGDYPKGMPSLDLYWQNDYHHEDIKTKTDDAYFTFYHSFARNSVKELEASNHCSITHDKIREVTLFSESDSLSGMLLLFSVVVEGKAHQMETYMKPKYKPAEIHSSIGLAGRLVSLQVGTDFDPKELIFRNFGNFLGPYSDIAMRHEWGQGKEFKVTMVWIDPAGVIAGSFEVTVNQGVYVGAHKPDFSRPLRPGEWKVQVMMEWKLVAEVTFLITPLSHINKRAITEDEAMEAHGGPEGFYKEKDFSDLKSLVLVSDRKEESEKNGRKFDKDLLDWIDALTEDVWRVEEICLVTASTELPCRDLLVCKDTEWSSRSPDPKSEIGEVNPLTGRIER